MPGRRLGISAIIVGGEEEGSDELFPSEGNYRTSSRATAGRSGARGGTDVIESAGPHRRVARVARDLATQGYPGGHVTSSPLGGMGPLVLLSSSPSGEGATGKPSRGLAVVERARLRGKRQ